MASPASPPPPLPTACTTCTAPLPAGSDRCTRCGTLHGEFRVCPHCRAKAEVIPKSGLIFVCAACGKPRVPVEKPVTRTYAEAATLAQATDARGDWLLASVAGIAAMVPSLILATTAVILLMTLGLGLGFFLTGGIGAAFGFVALFALGRAAAANRRAEAAMGDAFGAVALDAMRTHGPLSAPQLAEILGVSETVASEALARLPARTDVRVDTVIDDRAADGQVRYRIEQDVQPGVEGESAELAAFDERLRRATAEKQGKS